MRCTVLSVETIVSNDKLSPSITVSNRQNGGKSFEDGMQLTMRRGNDDDDDDIKEHDKTITHTHNLFTKCNIFVNLQLFTPSNPQCLQLEKATTTS